MPYKIGDLPAPSASQAEIADYLEVKCLLSDDGDFSIVEAARDDLVDDEDQGSSIAEDAYSVYADALNQIDSRRKLSTRGRYPFAAERKTILIDKDCSGYYRTLYSFLLFATRWNMGGATRIIADKDGTLLFERLCREVLARYFGPCAESIVFGTGAEVGSSGSNGFESKVKNLLDRFSEKGYRFGYPDGVRHQQKDNGIDLVAFIPFIGDDRKGHFTIFGQCKTGTSWRDKLGQMNPKTFCELFLSPPLRFTPISIYMVSEACDENWEILTSKASGVLFDRTRIVQFLPEKICPDLYNDIKEWVEGVKRKSLQ